MSTRHRARRFPYAGRPVEPGDLIALAPHAAESHIDGIPVVVYGGGGASILAVDDPTAVAVFMRWLRRVRDQYNREARAAPRRAKRRRELELIDGGRDDDP